MKVSEALSILETIKEKSGALIRGMAKGLIEELSKKDSNDDAGLVAEEFISQFNK